MEESGQSTIEAALLLPATMFVLAIILEPACFLYTKAVMQEAAASGARALATSGRYASLDSCREYVMRRLKAVPDVSIFHVGGNRGWEVSVEGGEGSATSVVEVTGHVKPLPLFGVAMAALGQTDDQGVILRVRLEEEMSPSWLDGGYEDWVGIWET